MNLLALLKKQKSFLRNNLILIFILLIPLAVAQQTLQFPVTIENSAKDITLSDIKVLENENKISLPINLVKIQEDEFYIYFNAPYPGDYKIQINTLVSENNILKEKIKEIPFTVSTEQEEIQIDPAVIVYKQGLTTFKIKIKNLEATSKNIPIISTGLEHDNSILIPGNSEKYLSAKIITDEHTTLNIGNYKIPIYVFKPTTQKIRILDNDLNKISSIQQTISQSTDITFNIKNLLDKNQTLNLELKGDISKITSINPILTLNSLQTKQQTIEITPLEEKIYSGYLQIDSITLPISINYEIEIIDLCGNLFCDTNEEITCPEDCPATTTICGDGICEEEEICEEDCLVSYCGDGFCDEAEELICPQDCEEPELIKKEPEKKSKLYIYIIIAIIIIIALILFSIKGKTKKESFKEYIKRYEP